MKLIYLAKKIKENEYNVFVLKDYIYCTHGIERKNNAIEILKRNIGKNDVF
ncbi:MAG: hypothetical protein IKM97_03775 [Clostridia bacterium]|nr:hypothetical protein [Clostridia bacterium]